MIWMLLWIQKVRGQKFKRLEVKDSKCQMSKIQKVRGQRFRRSEIQDSKGQRSKIQKVRDQRFKRLEAKNSEDQRSKIRKVYRSKTAGSGLRVCACNVDDGTVVL